MSGPGKEPALTAATAYKPRFEWRGQVYETALITGLSWAEMDLAEQITGLTQEELMDRRLSRYSRVSVAFAVISINRVEKAAGLPLTSYEEFREGKIDEVSVMRSPVPGTDTSVEEVLLLPDRPPAQAAEHPHPDAPMYERLGDADPTVADSDGSAPTSQTSEPNTSEPSPTPSGSDPGTGTGSTSGTASA